MLSITIVRYRTLYYCIIVDRLLVSTLDSVCTLNPRSCPPKAHMLRPRPVFSLTC